MTPFTLYSWPSAILHVDGDAFFASCEEVMHPELRGKPLITGGERGIVACPSYAAKKLGIRRGVTLREAKAICPELIILPSDYETYSLFSRRMFNIIRQFTPQVEEYSIDEAFADLAGMRRALRSSYEKIALKIKKEIEADLGLTVSVGLSVTKVLAKAASKYRKPSGFTVIPGREIPLYIRDLPVENIWGIGPATTSYLGKMGIRTALQFARLPEEIVRKKFTKPGVEIWRELRGDSVYPVSPEEKSVYASICKSKTFAPATNRREYIFAQLMRNFESACLKARRYDLAAKKIVIFLRKNNFDTVGAEAKLVRASAYPMEMTVLVRELFDSLFEEKVLYRSTGTVLLDLMPDRSVQRTLFECPVRAENVRKLYEAADIVNGKFGKHTLHLGGAHAIDREGKGRRGEPTEREKTRYKGEGKRKHLGLPILHIKV
ncbi:MAG: DNA polymerase IV [Syntrophales bacterium]|nr:DNA polymerase IV [Syntrophales bacterium]